MSTKTRNISPASNIVPLKMVQNENPCRQRFFGSEGYRKMLKRHAWQQSRNRVKMVASENE
jgi:hypothetical protein